MSNRYCIIGSTIKYEIWDLSNNLLVAVIQEKRDAAMYCASLNSYHVPSNMNHVELFQRFYIGSHLDKYLNKK